MGLTAEKWQCNWKISREAQDAFALQSHQRALAAQAASYFDAETTPFKVISRVPNGNWRNRTQKKHTCQS